MTIDFQMKWLTKQEEVEPVDFKLNFSGQGNIHYQEGNILNLDEITDDDENSLDVHKSASNKTA